MKVSVIVAVYNTAPYLEPCLQSLLEQTHGDVEILCVDDCSTDNSPALLQQFARRDNRIKLFRTPQNSGPAVARNIAIAHSTGELTAFVDSDDWLSPDAIGEAVHTFTQHERTDCVLLRCISVAPDGTATPYPMDDFEVKDGLEAFTDSLSWKIHGVYVARTSLYRRFPYDTTCRTFSDDNTTRLHYYSSREVRTCRGTYYYRHNPQSISNRPDTSRINHILANESMKRQLLRLKVDDSIISLYEYQRWLTLVDTYMFYCVNRRRLNRPDKAYCLREMKRIWQGMETHRIALRRKLKLGYYPFKPCWTLFRLQEELYFLLKTLLRKR